MCRLIYNREQAYRELFQETANVQLLYIIKRIEGMTETKNRRGSFIHGAT